MAKALLAVIVLCGTLATPIWAAMTSPTLVATPPQPQWSELTVKQKIVLAPLSDDWDSLEYFRQKMWLGIATRFQNMTPHEQRRIQIQMQAWGKLTPEQRELARENYKAASQLPTEKKLVLKKKWEEYSRLPEEEKEKLKRQALDQPALKSVRPVASTPPSPAPPLLAPPPISQDTPIIAPPSTADNLAKP